ncbi:hypothetical protein NECID01_0923 [Nematocida sp. AWRm77]|nr:hypothetical protein NECID01_0923 [Nematocida sp. AWRm77]
MNISFEESGGKCASIKSTEIEPFTQKSFWELCQESFLKGVPHVVGRTEVKEERAHTYYDARQLCKFLFELVISKEGRQVSMKHSLNPVDDKAIKEISFFEVHQDNPTTAVLIGTQKDFLTSSKFRSRIFNRSDPFDALSINFVFKDKGAMKVKKKILLPLLTLVLVLFLVVTSCTVSILRNSKLAHPPE